MAKKIPMNGIPVVDGKAVEEAPKRRRRRAVPDTPQDINKTLVLFAEAGRNVLNVREAYRSKVVSSNTMRALFSASKDIRIVQEDLKARRNSEYKRQMNALLTEWANELSYIADGIAEGRVATQESEVGSLSA